MRDRRIGKFRIKAEFVHSYAPEVLAIMSKCAVIEVRYDFASDQYRYGAISDQFREVPEGELAPYYIWLSDDSGNFVAREEVW